MRKTANSRIYEDTYKRLVEYCDKNGHIIYKLASIILDRWLDEQEKS